MTDPPVDFADAMDESDGGPPPPPQDASSPPFLAPPSAQVVARYEGCSLCAKAKVRVRLLVFVSPRFRSLCLASTLCRRLLQANRPSGSALRRSAFLVELDL